MSNTEAYKKMIELAQDKQQYVNPIVTKFLRLNMQFFRKTQLAFNDLKSMDVNSRTDYEKLDRDAQEMGTKDQHLNRMMVFDKQDRENRESMRNYDQLSSTYANYNYDATVYNKDVHSDYSQRYE